MSGFDVQEGDAASENSINNMDSQQSDYNGDEQETDNQETHRVTSETNEENGDTTNSKNNFFKDVGKEKIFPYDYRTYEMP